MGTGQHSGQRLSSDLTFELKGTNQTKTNIIVAIRRRVVVAIRNAAVMRVVSPATAAIHAVRPVTSVDL